MRRRCREPVMVQQGAHVARRPAEVARELDFSIPGGGDSRDRALDILFHLVAHRVQLQPDAVQPGCGKRDARCGNPERRERGCAERLQQRPAIGGDASRIPHPASRHSSLRFMASTAYTAARAVSAMYVMEGFWFADEAMQAPSVTNRFFTSWHWLWAFRTEVFGSRPIRAVPISWIVRPGGLSSTSGVM